MFTGCMVAIVTPFANGEVDFEKVDELVEFHVKEGTDAIVVCGTTGESPALSHAEHDAVVERVIAGVAGRTKVIAGSGSNSTREALRLTRHAKDCGADGALLVSPYYNKPTQEGLYRHYKAIAESVDIPIMLYNVPGRTGMPIAPETVARLAEFPNIVSIKEAAGSVNNVSNILSLTSKIQVVSGDDSLTLPMLAVGAVGVVSVVANIVPADVKKMVEAYHAGEVAAARALHAKLFPLCEAMFIENNPMCVKAAMKVLARLNGEVRLPLVEVSQTTEEKIAAALADYGLL
jgi:4-hydroxy-tetrahydrodipicolinate synthase